MENPYIGWKDVRLDFPIDGSSLLFLPDRAQLYNGARAGKKKSLHDADAGRWPC